MDREKLVELKEILDEILYNEPSDEELDYDEDAIEMYYNMRNLRASMEKLGF